MVEEDDKVGPHPFTNWHTPVIDDMGTTTNKTYVQIETEDDEAVNVTSWWPHTTVDLQGYYGNWTYGKS